MDRRPQLVLLFGGPGAGKGTQATLLSKALGVPHVSSGELLREHQRNDTRNVMSSGELLPDDLVTSVVLARLEQADAAQGAILDGFPRTVAQAAALDAWLAQHGGTIRAASAAAWATVRGNPSRMAPCAASACSSRASTTL